MVTLLLKKSYRHKDLKEIKFHDLWNSHGVFTTMRIVGKPARILFFKKLVIELFLFSGTSLNWQGPPSLVIQQIHLL